MDERLLVVEQVVSCTACELHTRCTAPVPFYGPAPNRVAVVGEAPGRKEDEAGRPFVGPAGELLRDHLKTVGIPSETVTYLNTVSCFPDATPKWAHVNACADNKRSQLDLVAPEFVLVVGKVALKGFRPELEISRARGRPFRQDGRVFFPTYHPAAALRNRLVERSMHEDLLGFSEMLKAGSERWSDWLSDKCVMCSEWMFWIDDDGLTYCTEHMPEAGKQHRATLPWLQ